MGDILLSCLKVVALIEKVVIVFCSVMFKHVSIIHFLKAEVTWLIVLLFEVFVIVNLMG